MLLTKLITMLKMEKKKLLENYSYWPDIDSHKLIADYSGIRTKSYNNDFIIKKPCLNSSIVNLYGIDSPGLTSCFAIADYVFDMDC